MLGHQERVKLSLQVWEDVLWIVCGFASGDVEPGPKWRKGFGTSWCHSRVLSASQLRVYCN